MNLKEFFKPNKWKFLVLILLIVIGFTSAYMFDRTAGYCLELGTAGGSKCVPPRPDHAFYGAVEYVLQPWEYGLFAIYGPVYFPRLGNFFSNIPGNFMTPEYYTLSRFFGHSLLVGLMLLHVLYLYLLSSLIISIFRKIKMRKTIQ